MSGVIKGTKVPFKSLLFNGILKKSLSREGSKGNLSEAKGSPKKIFTYIIMSSLEETLFGPLGKGYCLYFYIIEIIAFILLIVVALKYLVKIFKVRMNFLDHFSEMLDVARVAIQYLVVRLLYSMCSGALGR
jgi:hypothetical protein